MTQRDFTDTQKTLNLTLGSTKIQHGLRWSKLDVPGGPNKWSIVQVSETPQGMEDLTRFLHYLEIPTKKELSRIQYAAEVLGMAICTSPIPAGNVLLLNEGWMATVKIPAMTFTVSRLPDYVWQAFKKNYDAGQARLKREGRSLLSRLLSPGQS